MHGWIKREGGIGSVPILRMVRTPLQKGVVLRHVIKNPVPYLTQNTIWESDKTLKRALLNRKFHTVKNWYQFFTAREKLVPISHIFHTNISHFVKFAHVVKLCVACMRNLHIDNPPPPPQNLLHFAFDSNSSHICQDFITWFKQVTDKFHMFYS